MKNIKIFKLLLISILALAMGSCDNDEDPSSIVSSFEDYTASMASGPVALQECGSVVTLNFTLDEKQITDLSLEIHVGESSTATEGEDFDLVTHDLEIPAFGGQDGFSVDIVVYDDNVIEEGEDESIYLTFHSAVTSGLSEEDVLVATIQDKGTDVAAGETADFTLSWDYTTDPGDACAFDLDMTFQTAGTNPYDDDLLDFAASSLACPEGGELAIENMVEGEVYDVWVFIYAGEAVAKPMTVTIDYSRANSTFDGTITLTGVFDSGMAADAVKIGTIEMNCNKLTIKDLAGAVLAEGRVRTPLEVIHNVVKPF